MHATAGELSSLTLASISQRCADESERFFHRQPSDPAFCYELFRRAIIDRDELAWDRVFAQYQPLVAGWVKRHAAFPDCGEETSYFVNRALEKMWTAITPERFGRFPELKSLLRYLQLCVHSVIMDHVRYTVRSGHKGKIHLDSLDPGGEGAKIEDTALSQVNRREFWELIAARLNDEKERLVVYASYQLDLKPSQILEVYGQAFANVNEIYRVKENVLARLRRDIELQELLV